MFNLYDTNNQRIAQLSNSVGDTLLLSKEGEFLSFEYFRFTESFSFSLQGCYFYVDKGWTLKQVN